MEKSVEHGLMRGLAAPLASVSFDELAAQQGVSPIEDFDALMGHPSTEDESTEEFSAVLRTGRREATGTSNPK